MGRVRLDVALRTRGLAPSRAKAQELIRAGAVEIARAGRWVPAESDAELVDDETDVRLRENPILDFVSRAGRKLDGFLTAIGLEVRGFAVLDIGISTGGFT